MPASAQPECLPSGGDVYLCDPLDDGASRGDVQGGAFVEEGWQVTQFSDRILYDLGEHVTTGLVSVWMQGISMDSVNWGTTDGNKHHLYELFDATSASAISYGANVRLYGNEGTSSSVYGKVKFQYGSWTDECMDEVYLSGFDTSTWDADTWFHWETHFRDGLATLWLQGEEIASSIEYGDCGTEFRYPWIPIMPDGRIDSIDGLLYSHVSFSSCVEPCDDGSACTVYDSCVEERCEGTPMEDGEACDDGNPDTIDDACWDGECSGTRCNIDCDDGE